MDKPTMEFQRVMLLPVALYECPACKALVRETCTKDHADWHAGERMRNFGGF